MRFMKIKMTICAEVAQPVPDDTNLGAMSAADAAAFAASVRGDISAQFEAVGGRVTSLETAIEVVEV